MKNLLSNFSHIYVETDAVGYPITDLVLGKCKKSEIIYIKHYKDIFNRSGQDFQSQKASMKLILSKKKKPFLYPVSEMIQEYMTPNYFYTTPMVNCLYNCDYCFLQGMYNSANFVVFVNYENYFSEIKKIVEFNKSDKIIDRKFVDQKLKKSIQNSLPQFKGAHVSYISGLKSIGLDKLLENVMKTYSNWNFRQTTSNLNTWLKEKLNKHAPPTNSKKRRIKLKYIVQSNSRPPTIKIFTSHNGIVSKSYKRYLENSFREDFDLLGTPIRIIFKSGDNPFTFSKH